MRAEDKDIFLAPAKKTKFSACGKIGEKRRCMVRNLSVKNVEYLIRRQSCGEDRWGGWGGWGIKICVKRVFVFYVTFQD